MLVTLGLRVKNWDGWVLIPSNVRLLAYSYVLISCFSGKISHNILKKLPEL